MWYAFKDLSGKKSVLFNFLSIEHKKTNIINKKFIGRLMLVMILAGGYGSRIADVADKIPKPMIMLDDKPMIEHIIDIYKKQF